MLAVEGHWLGRHFRTGREGLSSATSCCPTGEGIQKPITTGLPLRYHYSEKTRDEFEDIFDCGQPKYLPDFHYHYITTERDQNDPILTLQ